MIKKILILLVGLLVISCNNGSKASSESPKNVDPSGTESLMEDNFDWLLGEWRRISETPGEETFENWYKISPYEYYGIGFTMQNGDTIRQEQIRIVKLEDKWDLVVKSPEDIESTTFPITELKSDEFTCTNDSLHFPKQIKYWKDNEKIRATVTGDALKIEFDFEKIE